MKHFFKQIVWLVSFSILFLTGCQKEDLSISYEQEKISGEISTRATNTNYLSPDGIFVLSEGNMTDENGTLSYINGTSSTYPAQNWVYRSQNSGKQLGNVAQDMFIANNKVYILAQNGDVQGGAKHILITDNTLTPIANQPNTGNYFATDWSATNPTHLAVSGNTIFVRTNENIVYFNEQNTAGSSSIKVLNGINNPARTRMAMVNNSGTKYLYVGSEHNKVYRINTVTNRVESIPVQGKVAGLTAVRRNNNTKQYVWAFCIKSNGTAALQKISGATIQTTHNINISSAFDANLFIPSVGLCCDARGEEDILYFRGNSWNPTKIYKFDTAGAGEVSDFYQVSNEIDPRAKIIYGDLGVDQNTGDVYFGYVGDWWDYQTVNGIVKIGSNGKLLKHYKAGASGPYKIDTRFTAGIYFVNDFNM